MKSKYLHIKSFHSILLIIVALLMNATLSFGQNDMTKMKDGSVKGSSVIAAPYSILELESTTKGFLLPRMTTNERNELTKKVSGEIRGNGLAIYNTDNDCINYWSETAKKWLSICGSVPPAKVTLNCNKIRLNASGSNELKQGQSLKDTDLLYITLDVIESGSYTISGVTNNGYSFSKAGVFETPGTYTVALEGFGTPLEEKIAPNEDAVVFKINGKEDDCKSFKITVKSSELEYKIVEPQTINVNWSAYQGVPLNSKDNSIKVQVNVTTPGFWRIQSDKIDNGISFSGSGEFTENDLGPQTVTIYGQGTPLKIMDSTFKLNTNSKKNPTSNVTVTVRVLQPSFELVCDESKIDIRGEYKEDTPLNKSNSILLPLKVLAPGLVNIELLGTIKGDTNEAIIFEAPNTVLTFNGGDNIQNVILYPKKVKVNNKDTDMIVPVNAKTIEFNSITPGSGSFCPAFPPIKVVERSKVYTFDCSGAFAFAGSQLVKDNVFYTNKPLVAGKHGIIVSVNVGYADKYTIKTNTVNGVYFEKSGVFTDDEKKAGKTTVILDPYGQFTNVGNAVFTINAEGITSGSTCSVVAQVRGQDIVVLSLGSTHYGANSGPLYAGGAILKSPSNFGPNGKVNVNSITVLSTSVQGAALESFILNNKVDIIVNVIGYNFSSATQDVLASFVRDKKGVLIVGDENTAGTYTKNVVEKIAGLSVGGSNISVSGNYTMINPVAAPTLNTKAIIEGPFGDLKNKSMGNDAHNGYYYSNLPNSYEPLVYKNGDTSSVWAFKHSSLGFMFVGDGGWFIGTKSHHSKVIFPSNFDASGYPLPKDYTDETKVYNAILYANALAWAIDYVTENKR